eukprot:GHVO01057795.1.p2 GENE.GHVO01057795.1~~GHVO01057795.1.p2  ORF type:complete len:114 (+),score=0.81 GHVO01057795.1:256-597(+)
MAADLAQLRHRLDAHVFHEQRSSTPSGQHNPGATSLLSGRPASGDFACDVHEARRPRPWRPGHVMPANPEIVQPWSIVRRRKKKNTLTGTQECVDSFRGSPEVRSVFVWNVSK